jgi:acid phosphatase family membrane protein YuiD
MLIVSIILEAAVAVIAVLAARKHSPYFYGLALTFGIYVLYDAARMTQINVQQGLLSALFLIATLSALIAVWGVYRKP